jgi:hypothetical protein
MAKKPKKCLSKKTILDRLQKGLKELNCTGKKDQAYSIFCRIHKGEGKSFLNSSLLTIREIARLNKVNKRMLSLAEKKVK